MRTPRFSIEQDDDSISIKIHAPYCDLKNLDIDIENEIFIFFCKPYFLRLCLTGELIETDASSGKFIAETQDFLFKINKANKGEYFPDLDMITKLLQPPKGKKFRPTIEILPPKNEADIEGASGDNIEPKSNDADEVEDSSEYTTSDEEEWYMEQENPNVQKNADHISINIQTYGYGFANRIYDALDTKQYELNGMMDNVAAICMNPKERRSARIRFENETFDADQYVAGIFDDDIDELCDFVNPWKSLDKTQIKFTDDELDILKELPNKEYILTQKQEKSIFLGLIDILYAYCFENRTFQFEKTCESGWAINKLSATLSWFDSFDSLRDMIITCFRRSLRFPLHRNFVLSLKAFEDLQLLLGLGRNFVLHCLLDIYTIFNSGSNTEPRYLLNEFYIKDYCIFMQKCTYNKFQTIVNNLDTLTITKGDLGLHLDEITKEFYDYIFDPEEQSSSSENSDNSDNSSGTEDSDDSSTDSSDPDSDSSNGSETTDEIIENLKNNLFIN